MEQQLEIETNSQEIECPLNIVVTFVVVLEEKHMRKHKGISSTLSKTEGHTVFVGE